MAVPNDGSWAAADLGTTPGSEAADDDGPTIGPNGVNDPNDNILAAARTAWAGGTFATSAGFTIYAAGGTTALTNQPADGATLLPATLDWCKFYSTEAPSHYCKADGDYDAWQKENWGDTIDACCQNNHAAEYNTCFETSAGVVSFPLF